LISKLEQEVIFKYLKARKKDGFFNIISIFSFIGISLGVAVLIIVMSVMNGFRTELVDKILGFNAHAIIQPIQKINKLKKNELNQFVEKFIISNDSEGVLIHRDHTKGLLVRGYKENDFQKLNLVKNKNFEGNKKLYLKHISIGEELSINLNLKIGDKILIMSPSGIETLVGNFPKQQTFIISSIFSSDLNDFENNVVFINIKELESLFNLENSERYIEIYLKKPDQIELAKKKLEQIFNNSIVNTWSDFNSSLFMALKVERNVMFIILSLIIIVAAFNIISGLTIFVKNKTREIAILKSIGVLNKSIIKIFFMIGFIIGLTATLFGIFLGVIFSIYIENIRQFLSNIFDITLFPEEIYFLSKMPSELNLHSILLVAISSIIITSIVSLYPALKASKLDIIQSLKYE
tara:strand:- start:1572 stop:2792 length:1221 start_codon:yes stop_codon:yes gene_type:complete